MLYRYGRITYDHCARRTINTKTLAGEAIGEMVLFQSW